MKNIFKKLFPILMLTVIAFSFPSCEEDTDQWIYDGEALASFPNETNAAFFVQDIADPSYDIAVALNTTSGSERKVNISIDSDLSTAVLGTHFTMDTVITIPANEVIGYASVKGIYSSLSDEPLLLALSISGDNAAEYDNTYTLSLNKFVPFDIANFTGTFECVEHSYFGDFTYDVTLTPGEGDTIIISPFGGGMEAGYGLPLGGLNDLKVIFNTSDPAAFSTFMPEAEAFVNEGVPWYYTETSGVLNTLTNSFTLGAFDLTDAEGPWDLIAGVEYTAK